MRLGAVSISAAIIVAVCSANAQQPRPAFEVASVRRDLREGLFPGRLRVTPSGRFDTALDVRSLIRYAYKFEGERIEGPETLLRQNFVVAAKAPEGVVLDHDIARQMLQSLLEDRFQLQVRIESEMRDGLVLRRARADRLGPNLIRRSEPCTGGIRDLDRPVAAPGEELCSISTRNERMRGTIRSMADFAGYLSVQSLGPVRDETGLDGSYSVDVTFDPVTLVPALRFQADSPWATHPTVSEAFRDSLGLRLDKELTPGRVLIIERVEPPTEN